MEKSINPSIFKAYDIRGLYPSEIDKETAFNIGRALVEYTGAKKVVVGFDMRGSSLDLQDSLIEGITIQGADVLKIGLSTTPMLYFASWNTDVDAAVMITASHNPSEYNGFKFCLKDAVPIGEGSGMEEIRDLAVSGKFLETDEKGKIEENNKLREKYTEYVSGFFKKPHLGLGALVGKKEKKKIVIDYANAMGIIDAPIYEKYPDFIEVVPMYDTLDGSFPNHEANPIKTETLKALQEKVVSEKADLGVSLDGDADRVGFVDEKGEIVPMDYVIAILAKEILKENPGGLILMDLRSSNAVREVIVEAGGKVNNCRVGHSLIKKQMREQGAIFAGELSGHYFFEENKKAEMTALAVLTIINLLNETGQKLSDLTRDLKRYFHSGEINSEVGDKNKVIENLKAKYHDGKIDTLDGVRIDYQDWWFNVRPSNTEPKLRLNLEAKTEKLMEEKKKEVLEIIRK